MKSGEPFVLVLVAAPPSEPAERLARELVDRELAACVNRIGPIRSTYRWHGEVETAEEEL
ncbi:MAG: divalent-cation tolerance protein CutA, partial [Candidatus Latescibacterota bacterium]